MALICLHNQDSNSRALVLAMTLLAAVYWIENFDLCGKHMRVLTRKLGLVTRNVLGEILRARLNEV